MTITTSLVNRRALLLGGAALALAGCGGRASADEPPKISYGRDTCARCRMIVSDERYAAALTGKDAGAALFDDPGELVAFVQESGGLNGRRAWVHDYAAGAWLDATTAHFAADTEAMTPMATGVVAFAEQASAEAFVTEHGGEVMSWESILQDWTIQERM